MNIFKTITLTEYPLLTNELLAALEQKVDAKLTTKQDCEFIEHYLTSIGKKDYLLQLLRTEGVDSFDDIGEALIEDEEDDDDITADLVTGCLLGCIHVLLIRVNRGEKIY